MSHFLRSSCHLWISMALLLWCNYSQFGQRSTVRQGMFISVNRQVVIHLNLRLFFFFTFHVNSMFLLDLSYHLGPSNFRFWGIQILYNKFHALPLTYSPHQLPRKYHPKRILAKYPIVFFI